VAADRNEYEDESWVPDEAIANLALEADMRPEETHEARAKRLLTENVDVAAISVIHIAKQDPNARLRLEASKYIMERVLGRAGESPATGTLDDLFDKLDRMKAAEAAMSQSGAHSALYSDSDSDSDDNNTGEA
jgi:hypothetical protein